MGDERRIGDALVFTPVLGGRLEWSTGPTEAAGKIRQAAGSGISRAVMVSRTLAYPASHHHPGYVDEDFDSSRFANQVSRRWRRWEESFIEACRENAVKPCVLRPAPPVGPGARGFFHDLLSASRAVTPFGYDPTLQLLHPRDLGEAIEAALRRHAEGVFNIVPREAIPLRKALRLAGTGRLALGASIQRPLRRLLPAAHPDWLEYLRYPFTAAGRRAERELGWRARFTSAQAALSLEGESAQSPSFDRFGMDLDYIRAYGRTLLGFLHDRYWRIEVEGMENVPQRGRAVLVGIHRGFMPWDGVMLMHAIAQAKGRCPRFLVHPSLVKFPGLANFMTKLGGVPASLENADWVLGSEQILGVYPEGIQGAFTFYSKAYELGRFGRSDFVRMALRNRAPIIPVVTAGSAEIFPILGRIDWRWFRRFSEWPFLPITPTFPLLPVPLPSKWRTRFLEPVPIHGEHPPEAAENPAVVRTISLRVRDRMQEELRKLLDRRRSIFFG